MLTGDLKFRNWFLLLQINLLLKINLFVLSSHTSSWIFITYWNIIKYKDLRFSVQWVSTIIYTHVTLIKTRYLFPSDKKVPPILPSQFPYLCNHFLIFITFVHSWISHKRNIFKIPLYCLYTNISFFFLKIELYSIVWMYQHLLISPAVNRHSGCFQFGTIINKGAINILTSFCEHVFFLLPKYLGVGFLAYSTGYT